jgi:hypothetical protein
MRFNVSGVVTAALFYGLLWYAFARGVDYGYMQVLAVVMMTVSAGWLTVGIIAESPLAPWRRRRRTQGRESHNVA